MIRIITTPQTTAPQGGYRIDTQNLPNPHDIPKLRPRNGQDPMVRCWILDKPETQKLLLQETEHILNTKPQTVIVTCSAGWHRSVTIGDELARRLQAHGLNTQTEHRGIEKRTKKPNTTQRGYGWQHQQQRERLLRAHKDGAPCSHCGRPMYRDPEKNFDGAKLEAEHSNPQKYAKDKQRNTADRLLHRFCNRSKGAGDGGDTQQEPAQSGFDWGGVKILGGLVS